MPLQQKIERAKRYLGCQTNPIPRTLSDRQSLSRSQTIDAVSHGAKEMLDKVKRKSASAAELLAYQGSNAVNHFRNSSVKQDGKNKS